MGTEQLEPWQAYPSIWKSQAAFFAYLRGSLRRIWSRYPPKIVWKNSQLFPKPEGFPGRAKKVGVCYYCGEMFAGSSLEVDHVQQAGSCNDWGTAQEFLHNLLDCNGNWVLACKPCHKAKTLAERKGISIEDAMLEKKVIAWLKKGRQPVVDFCKQYGYDERSLTNEPKRREALTAIFKEQRVQ